MVSRDDHAHAGLTFLSIQAVYANFGLTFGVWAVNEAIALICFDHVRQLRREDIVATVLAFFLASDRIYVLDGQVPVEGLRVELTLGRLAALEVDNGGHFHVARILLRLLIDGVLLGGLPTL